MTINRSFILNDPLACIIARVFLGPAFAAEPSNPMRNLSKHSSCSVVVPSRRPLARATCSFRVRSGRHTRLRAHAAATTAQPLLGRGASVSRSSAGPRCGSSSRVRTHPRTQREEGRGGGGGNLPLVWQGRSEISRSCQRKGSADPVKRKARGKVFCRDFTCPRRQSAEVGAKKKGQTVNHECLLLVVWSSLLAPTVIEVTDRRLVAL